MGIIEILKNIRAALVGLFLALTLIVIVCDIPVWNDCYEPHLEECKYAHSINQTYLYASGFIGPPEDSDLNSFFAFHPEEGCSEIPHGCVLRENEFLIGFRIPFTKLEWIFA